MNLKFGVLSAAILLGGLSICLGGVYDGSSHRPLLQSVTVLLQDGGVPVLALAIVGFAAQYLSLTGLAVLLQPLGHVVLEFITGRRHRDGSAHRS